MSDVKSGTAAVEKRLVAPELLELLVCPIDKAPLVAEDDVLACTACGRRYPVEDGIPNMLVDG